MTGRITISARAASRLLAAIKHHAPELLPMVRAMMTEMLIGCNGEEHLVQTRIGANSWYWERNGRKYYFRSPGHGDDVIYVLDAAQNGQVIARLRTELQAERFVRRIRRGK